MSAADLREERLRALVIFVARGNGWPISKDSAYGFLMSTFLVTGVTSRRDLADACAMGWLAWAPKTPGHLIVGPRAPLRKETKSEEEGR